MILLQMALMTLGKPLSGSLVGMAGRGVIATPMRKIDNAGSMRQPGEQLVLGIEGGSEPPVRSPRRAGSTDATNECRQSRSVAYWQS